MDRESQRERTVELLLAEHAQSYEMYRFSEEVGERRFNFYLTLVTAVIAGLAIADTPLVRDKHVADAAFILLVGLLLFGGITLARLAHRNENSSAQLRAIGSIRAFFKQLDPEAVSYLDFDRQRRTTSGLDSTSGRTKRWSELLSFGTGGLVETVQLINAVVAGVLAGLFALDRLWTTPAILASAVGAALAGWTLQFGAVRRYHLRNDTRREEELVWPESLAGAAQAVEREGDGPV